MIKLSHVVKRYGERTVVDDLSLAIRTGSVFGFLGQNGAGKTTTVKMMVGLAFPDAGEISIGGHASTDVAMREKIGFMPEAPYFYERLTGLEFLRFCAALFRRKIPDSRHEEILARVGIAEAAHRPIATYSKGMKQRLGFAQALVNDPEYVFLDEPLDGLDPVGRKEVKEVIASLHKEGRTVFFNSHILYDTEELCDEIGVIDGGKLLYAGPVADFCAGLPLEKRFVSVIESRIAAQQT